MKAKKVVAVLLASALTVSGSAAVFAADSSVSSIAESVVEEVAEADQTPVTAEDMTAENYADFITLSDYKNLAVGFADGEQVAEGDTVVIDFVGKVAPEVAAALAAAYETEAETESIPDSFAELIEEAESENLVESAAEDALTGILESEAEEMKDSIAEAVAEDAEWVEFDGGSAQDYELQIGSGAFIEGFEDQLIGHVIGDTVEIRLTFPEMYYAALAGQDVVFETTIKDAYHMSKDSVLQNVTEASEVLQYPQPLLDSLTEEYMTQVRAYYNMYFPAEEETTDSSADSLAESVEEAVESAAEAVENTVSDEAMMAVLGLDAATLDTIVKTEAKLEMTARAIVAAEGVDYEEAVTTFLAEYGYESVDAVLATGATQAQLDRAVYNSAAQKAILSYQDAE